MEDQVFNPDLLHTARIASGLSQAEAAKLIGVKQNTFSRWEGGLRVPRNEEVEECAFFFRRPLSFFYRPERPLGVDSAFMFHRKRARTKQGDLRKLHAKLNITRLAIASLLKHLADWEVRIPRLPREDYGSAREIATLVRRAWQMNRGPIRNLIELVEGAGAIVVSFDFGTRDVDAVGWWPWDTVPLMFLNSAAPADRIRFSLCHELGHLIMHELPTDTMEEEADQFAGSFWFQVRQSRQSCVVYLLHRFGR